jgi:hypothetical protein
MSDGAAQVRIKVNGSKGIESPKKLSNEIVSSGETLSVEQLVRMKDHGVTTGFIRDLARAGYAGLPVDDFIRLAKHGVTVEFIQGLRYLGYDDLSLDEIIRLKQHGVTLDFIAELKDLGYRSPSYGPVTETE